MNVRKKTTSNSSIKYYKYNKAKSNLTSPEKLEPDVCYTFNVNFDMDKLWGISDTSTFKKVYLAQRKTMSLLFSPYDIKLYPEMSSVGRLHWHGRIKFRSYKDIGMFYSNLRIVLNHMSVELDTIDDDAGWINYTTKGHKYMLALLTELKLPYGYGTTVQQLISKYKEDIKEEEYNDDESEEEDDSQSSHGCEL